MSPSLPSTPRFSTQTRLWVCVLCLCGILFLVVSLRPAGLAPRIASVSAAQPGNENSPILPAAIDTLTATLAPATVDLMIGTQQTVTLDLINTGTQTLSPRIYEAYAVPALGAQPQRAMPSLLSVPLPVQSERIDPQLSAALAQQPDQPIEMVVYLDDQVDLSAAEHIGDWGTRGWYVYRTLTAHADRTQQDMRAWLHAQNIPYEPLWVVNAILVRANNADMQAIAARSEVAMVRANRVAAVLPPEPDTPTTAVVPSVCRADANGICWNIVAIGASRVWHDFGVSGQGIVVASIDSGVRYTHPALVQQYRGYRGPGVFDHAYNWFDPQISQREPKDAGDHGTHTMGTMVGRGDGTGSRPSVGVAPGANWIAARGCTSSTCSEADLIAAAQWLLAPTDPDRLNPRPDLRPQIVNNSWAYDTVNDSYAGYVTAWRAAGIFPVFAAGNTRSSPACETMVSPGDYPNVVGVGAISRDNRHSVFSRIGPSSSGHLKPDIAAPGQEIVSTVANDLEYGTLQGTSMASPHIAGVIALIWSANPQLIGNYDATYNILTGTAFPLTDTLYTAPEFAKCSSAVYPNNVYGYGRVDAYRAVATARVDLPWLNVATATSVDAQSTRHLNVRIDARQFAEPGTYKGRILVFSDGDLGQSPIAVPITVKVHAAPMAATLRGTLVDETTGLHLSGSIQVVNGPHLDVPSSGAFTVVLPSVVGTANVQFVAQVSGYLSQTVHISLTAGMTSTLVVPMRLDAPRVELSYPEPLSATLAYSTTANRSIVLRNAGTQPLDFRMSVPSESYGVERHAQGLQQEVNGWVDLPLNAPQLALSDDTFAQPVDLGFPFLFYTDVYTQVRIGANGVLLFNQPREINGFVPGCFPLAETGLAAIAPLRVDLDPSKGGAIRYGLGSEGFIISYEQVPLFSATQTNPPTYTFQTILRRDGSIVLNYRTLGTIPSTVVVGVQHTSSEAQSFGCGASIDITTGDQLVIHPQPDSQHWLRVNAPALSTLAPGAQVTITAQLLWAPVSNSPPYRGTALIQSNDLRNAQVRVSFELTPLLAPYTRHLPLVRLGTRPIPQTIKTAE